MLRRTNFQLLSLLVALSIATIVLPDYTNGQGSCTTLNGRSGICIPVLQCKFIEQLLRKAPKPLPPQITQYIRRSHCGTFNGQHYACCDQRRADLTATEKPVTPQPVVLKGAEVSPGVDPTERLSAVGVAMLNQEGADCTVSILAVANGQNANLMEFPWLALLVYDDGVSKTLECGGSLISSRHVLTAAHCILVRQPKKLVSVRLGEYDIRTEIDCTGPSDNRVCAPPVQEIEVTKAVYHKDYTPSRFANDIGLLRLGKDVEISLSILPICLPVGMYRFNVTTELTVAGWGNTEKNTRANILQKANLPLLENDSCQKVYKVFPITDMHLCAGGSNETQSCRGDSGGPLFLDVERIQHGIVSGGSRKCGTNFPDVYTRVEPYIPWISSNIAALM